MTLRGNLRDFSITQLLNLVNLAHKTGTLVIESPGDMARISFSDGKLAYAQIGQEDGRLAGILYQNKKLSEKQYQLLQQRAGSFSDKELGLMLINAGYFSQEDILDNLKQHCTDIIRQLFTWVEGAFHFDDEARPPTDRINVRLNLENLIIEGSRAIREWEQLQDEIPSLEMALKFVDHPGANLRNLHLSIEEWRVVSFVSPRNTMQQIANATKMDQLEIRRVVYGLLQAGLVEIVRQEGAPPPPLIRVFPTNDKEEQKSLVNRLINGILKL